MRRMRERSSASGQGDLVSVSVHGLRRDELCKLTVGDIVQRRGVNHLKVHGKGGKLRYVPLHPQTAGHAAERDSPFFRPMIVKASAPGLFRSP